MVAQALVEHFFLHGLALLVYKHPVGKLGVPAEVMAAEGDVVLATEVGNAVGTLEVPHALGGVHLAHLHVVLSGDAVELFLHQGHLSGVVNVGLVYCHANGEVVFVGVFQSLCPQTGVAGYEQREDE